MSQVPENFKYAQSHEWVSEPKDGVVLVGISDFAQESLGDVTFIELPEVGDALVLGESFGAVESVKAASELYAPVSGKVLEVNDQLQESPDLVNSDPYGQGWMVKVEIEGSSSMDSLLSAEEYQKTF